MYTPRTAPNARIAASWSAGSVAIIIAIVRVLDHTVRKPMKIIKLIAIEIAYASVIALLFGFVFLSFFTS